MPDIYQISLTSSYIGNMTHLVKKHSTPKKIIEALVNGDDHDTYLKENILSDEF